MKMLNTAAAFAVGFATLCSALPAHAAPGAREQRFIKSLGLPASTQMVYVNAKGNRVAFPQFKQEVDKIGGFKIKKQGSGEEATVEVATRLSAQQS